MATQLQSGITKHSASDGSYNPNYQYGTSAWIIKIHDKDRKITGDNVVLSDAKSQCYHCSELCGIIGYIRNINNIFRTYNILEGSSELGYGGLETYIVVNRYKYSQSPKLSHYHLSFTLH